MNRYETNQKGTSPALSAIINEFAKMPRSAFDETRRKSLDAAPFALIPIECFFMFPNSEGWLNYDVSCITKNPTIKRMLSGMSVELRTYKVKMSDCWEGWNNFITRGRSGKLNLSIPYIDFIHASNKHTALPYNPYHYLNIAPAVLFKSDQSFTGNQGFVDPSDADYESTGLLGTNFALANSNAYKQGVSALPGVFYCKIAKELQNANLLQENPNWYPENENHDLILPYSCTHAANATYDNPTVKFGDTVSGETKNVIQPDNTSKSLPWLNVLYYTQRKGNYFNTGSPFPDLLRGDIPTLSVLNATLDWDSALAPAVDSGSSLTSLFDGSFIAISNKTNKEGLFATQYSDNKGTFNTSDSAINRQFANQLYDHSPNTWTTTDRNFLKSILEKATVSGIQFSLNQWRKLATLTVFRERMARTDGSYNQMIQAQFKWNPKWHEHKPIYCGGSIQPIVFSEVVQQSADVNSPLGTTAGRAVSSSYNKEIHVTSDDYSMFMTVMYITPDDYYSQGLDRMWTELTQAEQYFPILNNLEPQAIKNKELFLTGTDNDDEDVFNYQELFSHFKSRQNQVSGLLSLPISKVGDTGAFIFNRLFTSKPEFNNNFVTGKFTSNENLAFASTEQAQFVFSIVSKFKYVAPMPAVTQPSDMGLSY